MRKEKNFFLYLLSRIAAVVLVMTAACLFYGCERGSSGGGQYITVMDDFKTEYFVGDELDPTGTLKVVYQTDYFGITPIKEEMISGFDSSEQGDCFVTISFAGKTTKVLIRILPLNATAIRLNEETLPTVVYKGQSFPEGGTLSATMINGTVRDGVPIKAEMLGGFDSMRLGEQVVSVSYAGVTETFVLTVKEDRVTSIALSGAKTHYAVGEAFDPTDVKVAVNYESGKVIYRPASEAEMTGFSTALGGVFTARVTLTDYACDYRYSVGKGPISAALVEGSLPSVFEKGDPFPSTGSVRVTYDDGTTAEFPVAATDVEGFQTQTAGTRDATITIQELPVPYSYTVLKSISQGMPVGFTESVPVGAAFDGFGVLAIVYDDGESENIPLSDERLSLTYRTSTAGEISETVSYRNKTYTFTVTVYPPEERNAVESISLVGSFRPIVSGEDPEVEGLTVSVIYKYLAPASVDLDRSMLEFDPPDVAGDYVSAPITIRFLGKSVRSSITVLSAAYAARVTSISVYGLPSILLTGDAADYSSAGMTVYYGGDYNVEYGVSLANATVTGFDTSAPGTMTLTIEYEGVTARETIRVIAAEDQNKPTDAILVRFSPVLFVGDGLSDVDLTGAAVLLTLGYGYSESEIPLEASMLSGGPFDEAGQALLLFRYSGIEKEVTVTVHPASEKTAITAIYADEIRSTVGVYPDFSKVPLTVEYGYGRRRTYIPVSSAGVEVSAFSVNRVGTEPVEITYQGKSCSTTIAFAAAGGESVVESVQVEGSSQTTFEKGSALAGVVLTVTYASGGSNRVNVTAEMAPDFSTESEGNYAITIVYGGKSAVFSYRVA